MAAEDRPPKPLASVRPSDQLAVVVQTLFERRCSMAPVLATDPSGELMEHHQLPFIVRMVMWSPNAM